MDTIKEIANMASAVSTILLLFIMLVKPLRNICFGLKDLQEGQKCMLRADMLRVYYKHLDEQQIRQHEYENFMYEYKAYKALKGNSFIEHVKTEVDSWSVIP